MSQANQGAVGCYLKKELPNWQAEQNDFASMAYQLRHSPWLSLEDVIYSSASGRRCNMVGGGRYVVHQHKNQNPHKCGLSVESTTSLN
jgi:hypothetical protein